MSTKPDMEFVTSEAPDVLSNAERQRRYRRNNPERWAKRKRDYQHDNSKWQTDASYLARPFTAWDGEGITLDDGTHIYVMLAVKTRDESGASDYLYRPNGIGTVEAFEFILNFVEANPGAINVIYGGGYDFNMMFRDLPKDVVESVYKQKYVVWNGYRIAWRQGKSLYLARVDAEGKSRGGITIYDCAPFFQVPFVAACDSYLGEQFYRRDIVVKNKALRATFTAEDVPEVREYNDVELVNLLRLVKELRARLNKAGLRPSRWDGPGAVASALMSREDVKKARAESPEDVATAARYAYAGGRFEVIKFGSVNAPAYEYDVNSAYPSALRAVPNLARGYWRHHDGDPGPLPFALYHVKYSGKFPELPGAFFRRDENGTVCYPMNVTGWYWSPEYDSGREYCRRGYGVMEVLEAWEFVAEDEGDKPFAFIDRLYNKRRALKAAGDGAHVGIKLGLNSLYGKLAQQVGAEQRSGEWRVPPFHQLEWAGYTTSYCRAKVLTACLDKLGAVIAFETDAVFTDEPLDVKIGSELGDFERVDFERLTYVQSGMYFGASGGKDVAKSRGIDRGSLTERDILAKLREPEAAKRYAVATLTRFVGAGVALSQSWERWRRWETVTKQITLEPTGKRVHAACWCMGAVGRGIELGRWHVTVCPMMNAAHSHQFPILWANSNPSMDVLAELRDVPEVWD